MLDPLPHRPLLPLKIISVTFRVMLWLILAAWLLLGVAWATLHWVIVPRIDDLRPQMEMYASKALGLPVRIGSITAHADGLFPAFELRQIQLFDHEGQVALQLPRVQASLSPRSLLKLGFEQLLIESPQLDVRRSPEGKIFVAGLEISASQDESNQAGDWMFSQIEWVVLDGTLVWRDEQRGLPPLVLTQFDLVMRNGVRSHELRLDATPPSELGARFGVRGSFRQPLLSSHAGRWNQWEGQLYAVFERIDVAQLHRHVSLPLVKSAGHGALRAWVDVSKGKVTGATADVALSRLSLLLGEQLPMLDVLSFSGRLDGRLLEGGFEVSTQGLKFSTPDGLHWPAGDVRLSHLDGRNGAPARGELRATGLDLSVLARLAERIPLEPRVHEALQLYAPKGVAEQVQARWSGPLDAPQTFDARGRLRDLEIAAQAAPQGAESGAPPGASGATGVGMPGVRGLNLDFDLTQNGGRASVLVHRGHLELPGLFEQPRIAVEQLTGDLHWRHQGESVSVQLLNARVANADAQGEFQLKWSTADAPGAQRWPGVLELQGSLSRAELANLHRYLPQMVDVQVRSYLRESISKGSAAGVRFRLKGDLKDFPFSSPGQGEFRIAASVQDAQYTYIPRMLQTPEELPWPSFTNLYGDLVIEQASLQLRNIRARLQGAPEVRIGQGEARIADLASAASQVQVSMLLSGPFEDLLKGAVANSPLNNMLGGALGQSAARGTAEVQLKLQVPLEAPENTAVQGQIKLAGNELQFSPHLPRLTRLRGTVHFSEKGFALGAVQARLLGGDVKAEGGTIALPGALAGGLQRLNVKGTVTAQGLRQETALPWVARLGARISGSTQYEAEYGLRHGVPEFLFSSSLRGLGLDLPAPLVKAANDILPLRIQGTAIEPAKRVKEGQVSVAAQDQLRIELGRLVAIRYMRDVTGEAPQVLSGSIGIGLPQDESVPMPESGVVALARFDELDLDAWNAVLPASDGSPVREDGSALLQDYLPTSLAVVGEALVTGGQRFNRVVAGGTREGQVWRANLDAREFSGYVEYRQAGHADGGLLYARLARLVLAQAAARNVETLLEEQPVSIPALDVVVEGFELRGKNLGRVEIEAFNRGAARLDKGAREWRLTRLNVTMPEAAFSASGNWAVVQGAPAPADRAPGTRSPTERRRTTMTFRLDITDAGGLLNRLGMKDLVRRGKGQMEGDISWLGSPLALDYPTLDGNLNVNVESGQFLKAEPGIAKLLGVLSLQSLPRRLSLDFRDVFSEGFAFDFFRGDVLIERGIASTNNLQMKGVNAAVLMEGKADIARETQDLKIVVVPEINAGTASLIATWINPAIGLGTFLAQLLLRGPAIASATQEFKITGTWSDPQMARVAKPLAKQSETTP